MKPTIEDILQAAAEEHGVDVAYITQDRQLMAITKPRHIVQYLCRKYVNTSLKVIGELTGGRGHSLVTQAFKKIAYECSMYDDTRGLVEDIEENMRGKGFVLREVKRNMDNDWFNSKEIYR